MIYYRELGNIDYDSAWQLQEKLLADNLRIKAGLGSTGEPLPRQQQTKNYLLFCRHPHVYTLGKSGHISNLLVDNDQLNALNVAFHKTNRGGDITYHGPGQLVAYPIIDLEYFFTDLGRYMRTLEEAVIRTIAYYGIKGERLPGATGVWLDAANAGQARKICAMGVRCSRWVTMHGLALNINTNLKYFEYIVPCGISDKKVTSIQQETGREIDEKETAEILRKELGKVFETEITNETLSEIVS